MATVESVRSRTGTPIAADFGSGLGTPIVINMTTGQAYVVTTAGTITEIGAANPAISGLLALLTIGNANKTIKVNGTGTAFVAV